MKRRTNAHARGAAAGLALAMLGAAAAPAAGFSFFTVNGQPVVWAGGQSIRALSPTTFPVGSDVELLALEAMVLWNIVPSTGWEYSYATLQQDVPVQVDGINTTVAVSAGSLDPGVLGVTYLVNQGAQWVDMDVVFPDDPGGPGWTFTANPDCGVTTAPEVNGYSFLLTLVHEFGHALGLGHSPIGDEPAGTPWLVATMNPAYPIGGAVGSQHIVEVWTDDRNGLRALYPPSGPSGPTFTDLAVAGYTASSSIGFAAPSGFTPDVIGPGETVRIRAGLHNFGNTSEIFVDQSFYLSRDEVLDSGDESLGFVEWDIPVGEAFDYDVDAPLPEDLEPGSWRVISVVDDRGTIVEEFEDNNEWVYCSALEVSQAAPEFFALGQENIFDDAPWTGPEPELLKPRNMDAPPEAPVVWSIDAGPAGMVIDASTGVLSWASPVASPFPYVITVRATNTGGSSTGQFFLGVSSAPPACPGDVNGDGATDVSDFFTLGSNFGSALNVDRSDGDLDGDGDVDVGDFFVLASDFGCPN